MDIKDLLPIGSVVLLAGGKKRVMIFGVRQRDTVGDSVREYDYIGVLYPEGNMGKKYQFLFNHADIAEVSFRGLEDDERAAFIEKLALVYEQTRKDGAAAETV